MIVCATAARLPPTPLPAKQAGIAGQGDGPDPVLDASPEIRAGSALPEHGAEGLGSGVLGTTVTWGLRIQSPSCPTTRRVPSCRRRVRSCTLSSGAATQPRRFTQRGSEGERTACSLIASLQRSFELGPAVGPALRLDAGRPPAERRGLSRVVVRLDHVNTTGVDVVPRNCSWPSMRRMLPIGGMKGNLLRSRSANHP